MLLNTALFVSLATSFSLYPSVSASSSPAEAVSRSVSRTHTLPDTYTFDPRDGWQTMNFTDLSYKYRRGLDDNDDDNDQDTLDELDLDARDSTKKKSNKNKSNKKKKSSKKKNAKDTKSAKNAKSAGLFGGVIGAFKGLKAIGKPDPVTVTWYTGNDLKNPSCWPNVDWAPTDESFACALTLEGWSDKPKCFAFQEICRGQKCTFVRIVDSCAGCKKGAHHVDLTKAAFQALADFDEGIFTGAMRVAKSEPEIWDIGLFGPKA